MLNLRGKRALVFGVASEDSIAWAVVESMHRAGARINLAYQQRFKSRILQLVSAATVPIESFHRCDVTNPLEVEDFFDQVPSPIDIIVHSIAYANPQTFSIPIREVGQEDFAEALTTSAYSLIPIVRAGLPKMNRGGSVIAMTYLGGTRVVSNYRLMGIAKAALDATVRELAADVGEQDVRVNAISAGPIKTLAASQITGIDDMLEEYEQTAPLRRAITQSDVGNMATFLASDLSRNVTGQVIYVDAGYSILAVARIGDRG